MMSSLVSAKAGVTERAPVDLSGKLQWLCRFGKPRIGVYGSPGWHASIDMNTNTTGSSLEVKSEFGMDSPEIAVDQLIERMLTALAAIGRG